MVAKMGPDPLDNQFHIERTGEGSFGVFSMRKQDSDGIPLTRCEEPAIPPSDNAGDALCGLGQHLRLRPYWAHEQFEP
jgi:hypothetical protein